jgi:hypothetical protein
MQIILAGQPQLAEKLSSPNLVQLRQRISIVARLKPFAVDETNLYVAHRLRLAGYDFRAPLFTPRATAKIAEHSEGIPRNINNICFNALSLGCASKRKPIDEEIIHEVLADLDLGSENGMEMAIRESKKSAPVLRMEWRWPFASQGNQPPKASTAAPNAGMRAHGLVGLSRFATVAMLLLMLMWPLGAGQRNMKVPASQTPPAAATNAARFSPRLVSAAPSAIDFRAPETAAKNSPVPKSPAPETGRAKVTVRFHTATRSSRSVEPDARETSLVNPGADLAELWKEVGNGSTSAEVALASLYLDGIVVPQSCPQAQVLLSAARKKGNDGAENLLATYEKRCQ